MAEIVLSHRARMDLVEIGDYGTTQYGSEAADRYQSGFFAAFDRLADFPMCGAAAPEFGHGLRYLICQRHRIVYRIENETVEVIRILHHSRDVSRHLEP